MTARIIPLAPYRARRAQIDRHAGFRSLAQEHERRADQATDLAEAMRHRDAAARMYELADACLVDELRRSLEVTK